MLAHAEPLAGKGEWGGQNPASRNETDQMTHQLGPGYAWEGKCIDCGFWEGQRRRSGRSYEGIIADACAYVRRAQSASRRHLRYDSAITLLRNIE